MFLRSILNCTNHRLLLRRLITYGGLVEQFDPYLFLSDADPSSLRRLEIPGHCSHWGWTKLRWQFLWMVGQIILYYRWHIGGSTVCKCLCKRGRTDSWWCMSWLKCARWSVIDFEFVELVASAIWICRVRCVDRFRLRIALIQSLHSVVVCLSCLFVRCMCVVCLEDWWFPGMVCSLGIAYSTPVRAR